MTRDKDNTQRIEVTPVKGAMSRRSGALTVLSGQRAGTFHPIETELVVGRTGESTLAFEDESLSRRHARFFAAHGRYFVEDLKSTNGTFLNGSLVTEPTPLEDGARIQLGRFTVLRFTLRDDAELAERNRIYEATVRDGLTRVYNPRYLDERLASELSYAKRHGTLLSVLFVDADHFKRVNDEHGHAGGDEVLREIATLIQRTMRTEDVVARFGGEEFVVVVRGIPSAGVMVIAERIRAGVEALAIAVERDRLSVTVSIGVATHSSERRFDTVDELLGAADSALYRAKESGRNRIVIG